MRWCEDHDVDYVLGLARNEHLVLQLDIHNDVNSFLLFHEEVDPHSGFEQHVSLPEFDVSGQGLSFGRLESSEPSNIDHGLANGLAFGIRSLAVVLRNTRRIRILLSSTCPHQELFRTVVAHLDTS